VRRRALLRACAAGAVGLPALADGVAGTRPDAPTRPSPDPGDRPTATPSPTPTATDTPAPTPSSTATATPAAGFEPLARLPLGDTYEAVTGDDGTLAFVAVEDGFVVVDLRDPADPVVGTRVDPALADHADGPMHNVWDLSWDGDRLLVGAPGSFATGDAFYGLALYDVADPADPRVLSTFETAGSVHNCYLDGEYAYYTGDGLEVVHVTRSDPERVATWRPTDHDDAWAEVPRELRSLHDVWVADDRAYLAYWDAGAFILDVSDPADPTYLGRAGDRTLADLRTEPAGQQVAEPPGNAHYVQADHGADLLAVGKEAWDSLADEGGPDDTGGPAGVALWDIADPSDPTRLSTVDPPEPPTVDGEPLWTTAHNLDLRSGVLYSSWYAGGVAVHDVSDPTDPRPLAHWRDYDLGYFWTARAAVPGEYFVASSTDATRVPGSQNALFVFPDPTTHNPATPTATPSPTPTASPTRTATPTPTASPAPAPTSTPTDRPTGGDASPTSTPAVATTAGKPSTGADGPGLGGLAALTGLAALAGLGVGARRVLDEDE